MAKFLNQRKILVFCLRRKRNDHGIFAMTFNIAVDRAIGEERRRLGKSRAVAAPSEKAAPWRCGGGWRSAFAVEEEVQQVFGAGQLGLDQLTVGQQHLLRWQAAVGGNLSRTGADAQAAQGLHGISQHLIAETVTMGQLVQQLVEDDRGSGYR